MLSDDLVKYIITVEIGIQFISDYAIWTPNDDGVFFNKTTWNSIRASSQIMGSIARFGILIFLLKSPFLSLRLILGKLPFNDVIIRFGNHIVSYN